MPFLCNGVIILFEKLVYGLVRIRASSGIRRAQGLGLCRAACPQKSQFNILMNQAVKDVEGTREGYI
ncbi:unnamed protein product [Lathyrus sativus]|jgi:hypothetical protein|nr:unnamed protein product [Lathyrus sativus]